MFPESWKKVIGIRSLIFNYHNEGGFPQGGVGFILSRAAAEKLVSYGREWVKQITTYDDVELDKLRKYLNISQEETLNPFFYGEDVVEFLNSKFWMQTFPYCRKHQFPYSNNTPLINLVALHTKLCNISQSFQNLLKAKLSINNLYYFYHLQTIHLCQGKSYFNIDFGRTY